WGLILTGVAGAVEDRESNKPEAATPAPASRAAASAAETRLKEDVGFLAADAREGRAPGTQGIEAAADYIAGVFKRAGLKAAPGADGYFQPFTIGGAPSLGANPSLAFHGSGGKALSGAFKTEFSPLAIGIGGTLEDVPIVFAGYGITAEDRPLNLHYD